VTELAKINLISYIFRAVFLYTRLFEPNCAIIGFNAFVLERRMRMKEGKEEEREGYSLFPLSQGEKKKKRGRRRGRRRGVLLAAVSVVIVLE
jgi:hypothetical protein